MPHEEDPIKKQIREHAPLMVEELIRSGAMEQYVGIPESASPRRVWELLLRSHGAGLGPRVPRTPAKSRYCHAHLQAAVRAHAP